MFSFSQIIKPEHIMFLQATLATGKVDAETRNLADDLISYHSRAMAHTANEDIQLMMLFQTYIAIERILLLNIVINERVRPWLHKLITKLLLAIKCYYWKIRILYDRTIIATSRSAIIFQHLARANSVANPKFTKEVNDKIELEKIWQWYMTQDQVVQFAINNNPLNGISALLKKPQLLHYYYFHNLLMLLRNSDAKNFIGVYKLAIQLCHSCVLSNPSMGESEKIDALTLNFYFQLLKLFLIEHNMPPSTMPRRAIALHDCLHGHSVLGCVGHCGYQQKLDAGIKGNVMAGACPECDAIVCAACYQANGNVIPSHLCNGIFKAGIKIVGATELAIDTTIPAPMPRPRGFACSLCETDHPDLLPYGYAHRCGEGIICKNCVIRTGFNGYCEVCTESVV